MKWLLIMLLCLNVFAASYTTKQHREKHAMGLTRTHKSKQFLALKKAIQKSELALKVPKRIDLTKLVSPPENQGQCGSCWDFGITKALRSAHMLIGKDPGRLAFNYLLNNCGPGPAQGGCNGGDFDAGESMLKNQGPWLEAQDPYTEQEGRCKSGLKVASTAMTYEIVGDGQHPPSFQQLAQAIFQKHMLVIDVAVCGDWENYNAGIFNRNQCGPNQINHIINMNGYDCETSVDQNGDCVFNNKGEPINGDGYLIVMNNWGANWGENGLMRTRAHMNAIADTAMYFTVAKEPDPIPVPPVPMPPIPPAPPAPKQEIDWILVTGITLVATVILGGLVLQFKKK